MTFFGCEKLKEIKIPEGVTQIGGRAFSGCNNLTEINIPNGVTSIKADAFKGIDFKYIYITLTDEVRFSRDIPEDKYKNLVKIDEIAEVFDRLDYSILIPSVLDDVINLSRVLNKNKLKIPYIYVFKLIENGQLKAFYENSDFRTFKSHIPQIDEILSEFPDEEKLDFFKFANCLGCFSTEKMRDKKGEETETFLGQKASSLLAGLLKTDGMRLRKIS